MNKFNSFRLNLQFFAEDVQTEVSSEGSSNTSLDELLSKYKPEDILAHSSMKSVLDSKIGKATNTALTNARAKWEQEQNENLSEAEKLAKMTKDEREKYQFKKDRETFENEKAAFERDKLIVATGTELNTLNVDPSLAEIIVGKDAEETKTRMEIFTKAFNSAVEKMVDERLKGGKTWKKAPEGNDMSELEQQILKNMKGM